ncbi:MAG: TIGR02147 family protein [Bdellovibrionales bacterium]|nr:TIGR02147 family protein [Bdellovibrionales bacterium]
MAQASDYRTILQLELEKRVTANPSYSLRAFARDLSISPSRLCEILARKNGLSPKNAVRIANAIKLETQDHEWFYLSVCAQHSRSERARLSAQTELENRKKEIPKHVLQQDEFRAIAHWYHYGILELLNLKNFALSPLHVAETLGISKSEAFSAIDRLKKLGWIRKEKNRWVSKPGYRTFSSAIPSLALRSFHGQLLNKAEKAIHQQDISERLLHSLVLTTHEDRLQEANLELENFCYRFNKKFGSKPLQGEKLYALTLQFFKLSQETST